jgi:signal transduction histidine kinase
MNRIDSPFLKKIFFSTTLILIALFNLSLLTSIVADAQDKQTIQVKAFDQQLQPLKNIELSINNKTSVSLGNKGVAFIELSNTELPIQSIKISDEKLEAASWNFTKGILEVVIRKKTYQVITVFVRLSKGAPVPNKALSFKGKKSINMRTDGDGKFELPIGVDEKVNSANQFTIDDFQIVKINFSDKGNVLVIDPLKPIEEKKVTPVVEFKPKEDPIKNQFKDFDLSNLDSIQSITVFYAIFKNVAIKELNPDAQRKIDIKFNSLVQKLQDSIRSNGKKFIGSISDSSFVNDDIKNLLNQASVESRMLQSDKADFDAKIKIITNKLEKGIVNLDAKERTKLLNDLTLLENLLIDNESRFYKNQSNYKDIINSLKEKYFDIRNLENRLSETEAKRIEEQRSFQQRLFIISAIVLLSAILIIGLIYFSAKLRKQKIELIKANQEIKRINENLEGIVLHRTKLLKDTNQELDTFLYRASHDLRSPLTSIIGLCNIAAYITREELLDKITLITRGMDHLLKKLRMMSEINRQTNYSSIVLLDLVEKVRKRLNLEIENTKVKFSIDCPAYIKMETYPDLIEIILTNLIENSLLFSSLQNAAVPTIEFKARVADDNVEISIYDNGVGVETGIRPKLFDMFFKGHEKSTGNGLGLYIVQKSTALLKGKINMESETGKFTKFIVQIPIYNSTVDSSIMSI